MKWSKTNFSSADFYPSFGFIKYLTSVKLSALNEHFWPFMDLCQPCAAIYNFIGNFYNLTDETYHIISFLSIPCDYYLNRVEHPSTNTSAIILIYIFDTITVHVQLKVHLLERFSQKMLLYYLLYPADYKKDVEMLGLTRYLRL